MALNITVSLNVPDLPDSDFWFLNSAAWSNYWTGIIGSATINPIVTNTYVPVPFDNTQPVYDLQVDGVDKNMPSLALFNSLVQEVAALDASYQDLKAKLVAGGLITN
jgi:hypothetical protein